MKGYLTFLRKETVEIVRTWRLWVLPGMLVFFAVSGPFMARYTPEILKGVGGAELAALLKAMPKPTYLDSYGQWIKNLSQIVFFAIVIIYGGLISAERKGGTAILVLTKPLSRAAFVVAKASVHAIFISIAVAATTLLTWGVTRMAFAKAPGRQLWLAAGAWLALALLFLGVMTLLSTLLASQAGAAGIGLGVFALLGVAGMWEPLAKYSPAALVSAPMALAAGKESAILWPVVTSLALAVVCVIAAAGVFKTKEL